MNFSCYGSGLKVSLSFRIIFSPSLLFSFSWSIVSSWHLLALSLLDTEGVWVCEWVCNLYPESSDRAA